MMVRMLMIQVGGDDGRRPLQYDDDSDAIRNYIILFDDDDD